MIADTAFQASSPWLNEIWADCMSEGGSSPCGDSGKGDPFDAWDLEESDLVTNDVVSDLASLLSTTLEDEEDAACLQNITASDIDLLSSSVLSYVEGSRDFPSIEGSLSATSVSLFSQSVEDEMSLLNDTASVVSVATSSSGYSSGCDSCISNDDATCLCLQRHPPSSSTSPASSPATDFTEKRLLGTGRRKKQQKKVSEDKSSLKTAHKKWSGMTDCEQRQVIHDLTHVISSQLGMRERLEAIRIINPHARVSPTDTECYLDMAPINDSRFSSLQRFVKMHTGNSLLQCSSSPSSPHNTRKQGKHSSLPSAYASDHLVMCAKSRGRKRKGRNTRREQKALCQQLSKEEAQRLKEERSGFFVHEQRIAVSSSPCEDKDDDDDTVDILE